MLLSYDTQCTKQCKRKDIGIKLEFSMVKTFRHSLDVVDKQATILFQRKATNIPFNLLTMRYHVRYAKNSFTNVHTLATLLTESHAPFIMKSQSGRPTNLHVAVQPRALCSTQPNIPWKGHQLARRARKKSVVLEVMQYELLIPSNPRFGSHRSNSKHLRHSRVC